MSICVLENVQPKYIYRGIGYNNNPNSKGNYYGGKFFADNAMDASNFGDKVGVYELSNNAKIFRYSSSYDYAQDNDLMDERNDVLYKLSGYHTLSEAEKELWDTGDDPNLFYASLQYMARLQLEPKGYAGAEWKWEDELIPHQYQIWDYKVIKHIKNVDQNGNELKENMKEASTTNEGLRPTVEIEYEDLYVAFGYNKTDVDMWDEFEDVVPYTYEADRGTVLEYLADWVYNDPNCPLPEDVDDSTLYKYVEDNFDELFETYEDKLREIFREDAEEDASENYERPEPYYYGESKSVALDEKLSISKMDKVALQSLFISFMRWDKELLATGNLSRIISSFVYNELDMSSEDLSAEDYETLKSVIKPILVKRGILKESNELKKRAKQHRKKSKGMGWHMSMTAGDIEKGNEVFNGAVADGATVSGTGVAMGESADKIRYHYDGPVYYRGHKIAEYSDVYTTAHSYGEAVRNILYRVAKGDKDLYNYDIVDEMVREVEDYTLAADKQVCQMCGHRLSDGGYCPICDDGDEELLAMDESLSVLEAMWKLNLEDL